MRARDELPPHLVERFDLDERDLVPRDEHRIDALVGVDREAHDRRQARIEVEDAPVEVLPRPAEREATNAQMIVQPGPSVRRAGASPERTVCRERASDLLRPIARHRLRRHGDEPLAGGDPRADIDARRFGWTEEERRFRVAPFIPRDECPLLVEGGEIEIVHRRRRARVRQDAGVRREIDERS